MVGALADWFAVTALFRHPLGIPIPHTAIIPNRKDEIGQNLGEFVETEFLRGDVVRTKLEETAIAARLGEWLSVPAHAERVGAEGSLMAAGVLRALSDDDVQRRHRRPRPRAPHRPRLGSAARRLARPHRRVGRPSRRGRPRHRQHRGVARRQPRLVHGARLATAARVGALDRAAPRRRHRLQRGGQVRRGGAGRPAASGPHRDRRLPRPPRRQPAARPRDDRPTRRRQGRRCSTARACANSPPRRGTPRRPACSPRSPTRRAGCAAGPRRRSPRSASD